MKAYILFLLFAIPAFLCAQGPLSREVIATAGASSARASFTIGEPVIWKGSTGGIVLNQGFQQSDANSQTALVEDVENGLHLTIHPNPTAGEITLDFDLTRRLDLNIHLIDVAGRVVMEKGNTVSVSGQESLGMDLSDLPNGVYFLVIREMDHRFQKTLRIQKIN